jgi:acetylornithine/N-succinyldiaminopimelate aminotransferase
LRSLATQNRVLLVFDEVQTGIGRCGTAFAFQHFGVEPDIITLAKGIGGGVPLSALLCRDALDCFNAGDQGGTYAGNPLMAAVGLAVVQAVCEPVFLANVQARGAQLAAGLQALSSQLGLGEERGVGLLRALTLPAPVAGQVVEAARKLQPQGLLLNAPRPNLLRFMPALNINEIEIDTGLGLLRQACASVSDLRQRT